MRIIYTLLTVIFILAAMPFILWFSMSDKEMQMAIVNKSVYNGDVSDHEGSVWLFNHLKVTAQLDAKKDYYGPKWEQNNLVSYEFPTDFSTYDVIYVQDTYGLENQGENGTTEFENGLTRQEWNQIQKRLENSKKSLLLMEHNTLGPPTSNEVRGEVSSLFNMNWHGWIGKYVNDLSQGSNEIPEAIYANHQGEWNYTGEGFLLVNELKNEVVVLEKGAYLREKGLNFQVNPVGEQLLPSKKVPNYTNWFEITTAKSDYHELASFTFPVNEEGEKLLAAHEIPTTFSAVLANETRSSMQYYFAGDFDYIEQPQQFYQLYGLKRVNALAYRHGDTAFYWNVYIPLLSNILKAFEQKEVEEFKPEKLQQTARVNDDHFEVLIDGKWQEITIKGVNIGMGKPGAFPGEAAITYEEYYRWLTQIGEMNANTIRVYTLHPPDFYKAVADYNAVAENPIYVIHGVWILEEGLEETLDAYSPEILEDFRHEMKTISDVIHGNATVKAKAGHAYGTYTANISPYVIGWIIGIEWYPYMVQYMNEELYPDKAQFNGKYFETKNAAAFEIWLAEQMEYLFAYELETYNSIRPMAFSNWVPTDNLEHPAEPLEKEDLVSVDPNVIYTKAEAELAGQYASYHVYPYYPDFQNNDPDALAYVDHRGEKNTFAKYLHDLNNSHRLPILISEFGIPASRGLTHKHVYGYDQGFKSEEEQGEIVVKLFEDILHEKMLGGLVFIWQDEWFKRTWNTMGYDNPDRRPFWSNVQTNEQRFGLVAFESNKYLIDGKDDWDIEKLAENVTVDSDEAYVYLKIDTAPTVNEVNIYFDTVPNQGLVQDGDLEFSQDVEFVARISREEENSRFLTNPTYHFYNYENGIYSRENYAEQEPVDESVFGETLYILNRRLDIPYLNRSNPPEVYETGKLKEGTSNPDAPDFNSLTDYHWTDTMLEIRIPWLLLQSKDPSQREFMGNLKESLEASVFVDEIYIGVTQLDKTNHVVTSSPKMEEGKLGPLYPYTWEKWETPTYKERLKQSYYIIQEAFEQVQ